MKRSTALRLTLMAAAPAVLVGCDSDPTGVLLTSASDCSGPHRIPYAECRTAFDNARADHLRLAPRFERRSDCEADFDGCESIDEFGRALFIPPFAGLLMAYAIDDDDDRYASGGYYGGYRGRSVPVYRSKRGDYLNPGGGYVSKGGGVVKGDAGRVDAPTRAITVSRSGFGSTSAARSSFGSSRGS